MIIYGDDDDYYMVMMMIIYGDDDDDYYIVITDDDDYIWWWWWLYMVMMMIIIWWWWWLLYGDDDYIWWWWWLLYGDDDDSWNFSVLLLAIAFFTVPHRYLGNRWHWGAIEDRIECTGVSTSRSQWMESTQFEIFPSIFRKWSPFSPSCLILSTFRSRVEKNRSKERPWFSTLVCSTDSSHFIHSFRLKIQANFLCLGQKKTLSSSLYILLTMLNYQYGRIWMTSASWISNKMLGVYLTGSDVFRISKRRGQIFAGQ